MAIAIGFTIHGCDGLTGKGTYAFRKKTGTPSNNLMASFNRFGFILDSRPAPSEWYNRSSDGAEVTRDHITRYSYHSHFAEYHLPRSDKIQSEPRYQFWSEQEQAGGNKISLEMLLNTFAGDFRGWKTLTEFRLLPQKLPSHLADAAVE